jgi:hypothetical protein
MMRLMRENFECGLDEGEEYEYWLKINTLKERLNLLEHIPESAVNRVARTLLDLLETWQNGTKEERKDLVHIMLKEVGVDVESKQSGHIVFSVTDLQFEKQSLDNIH